MKKSLLSLIAASTLLGTSCSEKFDVAAPYKDITVVYGFLDMADTAHYIRIQKAFIDENKSAVNMAKEVDSNFYANLNVRIERYSATEKYFYVDSIHLDKVDLAQEGYTKQPGLFFTSPNYAYKFKGALNPSYIYRLKITNVTTGVTDSADAPVIDNRVPVSSTGAGFTFYPVDNNDINTSGMSFFSSLPFRYYTFDASYVPPANYVFYSSPNVKETTPATVAQAIIRFNWVDSNIVAKTKIPRYFDMDAGYVGVSNANVQYRIENKTLFNAINSGMGPAPENVIRLLDRCDMSMYLSTSHYNNYRIATQSAGTGLTGSEIAPIYTNIKGENVLGLFTGRAMRTGKITITNKTVDSLIGSTMLSHLRIKGTVY